MQKRPLHPELNVVPLPVKQAVGPAACGIAGSPNDPRTQEALRLVEAFLGIEDGAARSSLITLAERLVSYDWLRKAQQR